MPIEHRRDLETMAASVTEPIREPVYEFDYLRDAGLIDDAHDPYWQLKEAAPPVFWTPANGGHWVVTNADAAVEVLRHPDPFSNRILSIPPDPTQPKLIPESLDPPEHREYRQLLHPYFHSTAIGGLEPRIREWAERLIDRVAQRGHCEFVDEVGSPFPVSVFMPGEWSWRRPATSRRRSPDRPPRRRSAVPPRRR